jgi:hypothetical protein
LLQAAETARKPSQQSAFDPRNQDLRCSMWPAVLRIGFKPAKKWFDASIGLARMEWLKDSSLARILSASVFFVAIFVARPLRQSLGLDQIGFFQYFSALNSQ